MKRRAAIYSDVFPETITLYAGQAPLPRVGVEVKVKNFKTDEVQTYIVTERLMDTNEYEATLAE